MPKLWSWRICLPPAPNPPGELVVPGKSPPDSTAKDKAIAAFATDLNATALAKESSSNTNSIAAMVGKFAVSKKVRTMFCYSVCYEFIHC